MTPRGVLARLAGTAGLVAVAIGVRALPWREVLGAERVAFFGNDAWYHARRIAWGVLHFPERLSFDAYLAFPHGAKPIWSPGFDAILAAVGHALGVDPRGEGLVALERGLVWAPPVLGAAAVVAAMGLARRVWGAAEAWWTGAWLCVIPAHFAYTRIGFLDHHAAVAWLSTGLVGLAVALQRAACDGDARRAAALATGCGAGVALLLWVWPGALLHVACLELGLGIAMLAARTPSEARRGAGGVAALHGVAALAIAPAAWSETWPAWSDWSPLVLSRFQPSWLGAIALGAAVCAALWRREVFGGSGARRAASGIAAGALLTALAAGTVPALAEGVGDALAWLTRDDPFQRLVGESQPLFSQDGTFSTAVAWRRLGPFAFVYPLALLALAASARRRPERWVFVSWCAGLFAATLLQRRFFATASVGFACVLAATSCGAWRAAARHPRRRLLRGGVAVAAVAAALPFLPLYLGFAANEWRAARGEPLRAGPMFGVAHAGLEVADWLRANTPPTHGWLSERPHPEYGVLAPWHLGHVIGYRGRRPTVVDNFGDDLGGEGFAWARRVYASPEADAFEALRARRVRYVVAEARPRWLPAMEGDALHRALFQRDGSLGEDARGASLPALEHHRLVFETRGADFAHAASPARYKVFERVEGAEVVGRATPGGTIEASLALRTPRGRALAYAQRAVAAGDGTYRLRLPYATLDAPPGVEAAPAYRLACGSDTAALAVDEAAVREGRRLAGPTLCGGRPPGLTSLGAPTDEPLRTRETP